MSCVDVDIYKNVYKRWSVQVGLEFLNFFLSKAQSSKDKRKTRRWTRGLWAKYVQTRNNFFSNTDKMITLVCLLIIVSGYVWLELRKHRPAFPNTGEAPQQRGANVTTIIALLTCSFQKWIQILKYWSKCFSSQTHYITSTTCFNCPWLALSLLFTSFSNAAKDSDRFHLTPTLVLCIVLKEVLA